MHEPVRNPNRGEDHAEATETRENHGETRGTPKREMRMPYNASYPNFIETHPEDDWCAKVGCTPVCGKPLAPEATTNEVQKSDETIFDSVKKWAAPGEAVGRETRKSIETDIAMQYAKWTAYEKKPPTEESKKLYFYNWLVELRLELSTLRRERDQLKDTHRDMVEYVRGLRSEVSGLQSQVRELTGAMKAQDEREAKAGELCGVSRELHGCDWPDAVAERVCELTAQRDKQRIGLEKINYIRQGIVGSQQVNWSEHIYPLVAALDEAGLVSLEYGEARDNFGQLFKRNKDLESQVAELRAAVEKLEEDRWTCSGCGFTMEFCESCGRELSDMRKGSL